MSAASESVVIVGAGIGGLSAALELARRGIAVTVLEAAAEPGGKMRRLPSASGFIDAGPTVFTMKWVFEELFARAGSSLAGELELVPAQVLARHAWSAQERLDLHACLEQTVDAIGAFAGAREARGYRRFCLQAQRTYKLLERPFLRAPRPTSAALVRAGGLANLHEWVRIWPFASLWRRLGHYFRDPRLLQLFGRYATYCGSSPFSAPATLMLLAQVERDGVWLVQGGMYRLASALAERATRLGAVLRCDTPVRTILVSGGRASGVELETGERLHALAVISNADAAALPGGRFGAAVARATPAVPPADRSLSALTWTLAARTSGFPLVRHSVFFSRDYRAEFRDLTSALRLPSEPTVYVCAQDRDGAGGAAPEGAERLLCLVNAPPIGDSHRFDEAEIEQCGHRTEALLSRCGLTLDRPLSSAEVTTPTDFERRFPGMGGALYGASCHGWRAPFLRPTSRSRIPGLYLAGGSTHPGPGVPMAALSGVRATQDLLADLDSTSRSRLAATAGGTSMR